MRNSPSPLFSPLPPSERISRPVDADAWESLPPSPEPDSQEVRAEHPGESFADAPRETSEIRRKVKDERPKEERAKHEQSRDVEARIKARLADPEVRRKILQGDTTIARIIEEEEGREEPQKDQWAA